MASPVAKPGDVFGNYKIAKIVVCPDGLLRYKVYCTCGKSNLLRIGDIKRTKGGCRSCGQPKTKKKKHEYRTT